MLVRPATAADAALIGKIYDHHVRRSVATFDLEPQGASPWRARAEEQGSGDRVLVLDDGGEVHGFAYSSRFRPRPAYAGTRETSIYLAPHSVGRGSGRMLYDELLDVLGLDGLHTALAVVAQPNPASTALHRACGFTEVGTLRQVGYKHGRYVDTVWWQRALR